MAVSDLRLEEFGGAGSYPDSEAFSGQLDRVSAGVEEAQ
jgi:hypothetical protein